MNNNQLYDKLKRNREAKRFYNSTAWVKCRESVLIRDDYLCQECLKQGILTPADMVHHIKHFLDCPELALVKNNLTSLCKLCHNKEHPEKGGGEKKGKMKIDVVEFGANPEIT